MVAATVAPAPAAPRMAWLDALRGIAALAVVYDHLSQAVLRPSRPHVLTWIDPGEYGVFVFFLISGYIVPASLERKGSIRTFWVSRLFRLYPMYLVAIALVLLLWLWGQVSLRGADQDPLNAVFAQLLMMGDALAGPNLPNVVWSLAYEMTFYLLLTFLFIAGVHRRSGWYAVGLGVTAVLFGGIVPKQLFSGGLAGPSLVAILADAAIVAGVAGAIMLRGAWRLLAAGLAAGTAMLLLAVNTHLNWVWGWEIPTILGLMFTGTALYRADQGQYTWRRACSVAVVTIGLATGAGLWHGRALGLTGQAELFWERRWASALVLAGLTFGAGLALRSRRVPRPFAWLGLISYSMYLLHPMLVETMYNQVMAGHRYPLWEQSLIAGLFVVVLVGVSSVTYLLVEKPAQRLGRRAGHWLDARHRPLDRRQAPAWARRAGGDAASWGA